MDTMYIINTLELHEIPYTLNGGHVLASVCSPDGLFEGVEDITFWTRDQLYGWLGY